MGRYENPTEKDRAIFKRTATMTKSINFGTPMRGGIRL